MSKQHTIACGLTPVSRVYVKRGPATYRQNATVFVGGIELGEVFQHNGKWMASNLINKRIKPTAHKTATTAVKSLVCTQVVAERRR